MKKAFTLFAFLCLLSISYAQEKMLSPAIAVKWAPTGLFVGSISLQGEYNFGKTSLTAKIGFPANTHHSFTYEGREARFSMKAISFLAGYRTYLSKNRLKGFYLEPYFKYVHHTAEGMGTGSLTGQPVLMNLTNNYNAMGVGVQLGIQFLVSKNFVIDLFF